ncbi:MAG: PadR family transcriptional regulator [Betaproteobacteria bacterium]
MHQNKEQHHLGRAHRHGHRHGHGLLSSRIHDFLHAIGRHGHGGSGHGRSGRHSFGGDGDGIPRGRMVSSDDLQLLLLALLAAEPRHGYELIKALQTHSNGFYAPSPGMVYPALTYLEELGYVTAEHEGNRKRYLVAVAGLDFLAERRERADQILERLKEIGSKMDSVRRAFSGEGGIDANEKNSNEKADDESDSFGWHRDLGAARRALKHMLVQMMGAPVKRQREVAAILKRALTDIEKLGEVDAK